MQTLVLSILLYEFTVISAFDKAAILHYTTGAHQHLQSEDMEDNSQDQVSVLRQMTESMCYEDDRLPAALLSKATEESELSLWVESRCRLVCSQESDASTIETHEDSCPTFQ